MIATNAEFIIQKAEQSLGGRISLAEFAEAVPFAKRKLDLINQRCSANHGHSYLAKLIAESVKSARLRNYFDGINKRRAAEAPRPLHVAN